MNLVDRWTTLLEGLRAEGRYRWLDVPRGADFSSNDYLGYGHFRQLAPRLDGPPPSAGTTLARSGTASRLLRGHHAIWDQVESALASWHHAEAALMFSSGYVANEGLLATVVEPQDFLASDRLNHASIVDGGRLSRAEKFLYRHNDLDHLETGLREAARRRSAQRQLFVVTESLFGMEGDRAPLREMAELSERYQAHLIVDEAHATGCFGGAGSGCVDEAGLRQDVLATVHTGGKALGVAGAYVCGSARLRELLINRCRHFIYTTALPPVLGEWWLEALDRVRADGKRRRKLHEAAAFFRAELASHGIAGGGQHYIVPIILGNDWQAVSAAEKLQAEGWDIRAIRPPSVPDGTARLRISIHADHDPATLAAAAQAAAAQAVAAQAVAAQAVARAVRLLLGPPV